MCAASDIVGELNIRLQKYESVLKVAEEENNGSKVRRYKRIVGQYQTAIKQINTGKQVALHELPNPPGFSPLVSTPEVVLTEEATEVFDDPVVKPQPSPIPPRKTAELHIPVNRDACNLVDELTLRLDKYMSVLKNAEKEGMDSKVRRYKRIITQYNEAIKTVKAGKVIELSDIPNPPGFEPLVLEVSPAPSPIPSPQPSPVPSRAREPSPKPSTSQPLRPAPLPPVHALTLSQKQTLFLKTRQGEFREAAVAAKRAGQLAEAKEFLKIYKGFDMLIQASESGLPVDLTTVPASPKSGIDDDNDFHIVSDKDFSETSEPNVYEMLKTELMQQIKSCLAKKIQFKSMGDVANANRFENFALSFKKDLNNITLFHNTGQPLPKFHFEQKSFSIMQCFSEIESGNLELTIVQAVNLSKNCDTYVGYEFPYPSETPPNGYTSTARNSSNPKFNTVLYFSIDRGSKPCQRIFKRRGIKFEVWENRGLLYKDSSLGTVLVPLLPLSNNIMIHDAFDIMNGRRPTGAKLEVKIRVREPIFSKKIDTITEKWLIID